MRLDQEDLAGRAGVSVATIRRLEAVDGVGAVSAEAVATVRQALETAGAQFIDRGVCRKPGRTPEEIKARYEKIMGYARKIRSLPVLDPNFSLDDLYDENGLPK